MPQPDRVDKELLAQMGSMEIFLKYQGATRCAQPSRWDRIFWL